MLAELWAYLTTPCPPAMRRLGYLHETVAIAARQRRCRAAWQPHLQHTRRALLLAADRLDRRRTALILGSGHLLDVPLAELAERFQRVLLVDVLHPRPARRQARRYGNVELIEHDISECADAVLALPADIDGQAVAAWGKRPPTRFLEDESIDFVASVNLLSQLPLAPCQWLLKRHPQMDPAVLNDFALALMQRHLDYLAAFAAPACLIADGEQVIHNAAGTTLERTDLAAHFHLNRLAYLSWWWEIAPAGELPDGAYARHRVVACRL